MKGYFGRPGATTEVMRTVGSEPETWPRGMRMAWHSIVDRAMDMVIRGGFPREIEEALLRHDAVSLAPIVGVPTRRTARRSRHW